MGTDKMNYPHGWSFWSRDEWKALKNRRTCHYLINRVNARGVLTSGVKHVKHVAFVDETPRTTTSYGAAYNRPNTAAPTAAPPPTRRIRSAHAQLTDTDTYRNAQRGFKYWYDEPRTKVPHWQKYTMGTYKTSFGLQQTPKTFL